MSPNATIYKWEVKRNPQGRGTVLWSYFEGLFSKVKILGSVPGRSRDGPGPSRRVLGPFLKLHNLNPIRLGTVPEGSWDPVTLKRLSIGKSHFRVHSFLGQALGVQEVSESMTSPRVLPGPSRDRPGTLGGLICDLRISNLEDPRTAPGRVPEPSRKGSQDRPGEGPRTVPEGYGPSREEGTDRPAVSRTVPGPLPNSSRCRPAAAGKLGWFFNLPYIYIYIFFLFVFSSILE